MRLDYLRTSCRTRYGVTAEQFDKEIAPYNFDSAKTDVDEETVKAIKDACQIPQTTAAIASMPTIQSIDPRVDQLITGFQQLVPFVKAQNETIKQLKAEMVSLKQTAGEVTETLIREVEQLKETTIPIAPVAPAVPAVPAVPVQFAGFESVFG